MGIEILWGSLLALAAVPCHRVAALPGAPMIPFLPLSFRVLGTAPCAPTGRVTPQLPRFLRLLVWTAASACTRKGGRMPPRSSGQLTPVDFQSTRRRPREGVTAIPCTRSPSSLANPTCCSRGVGTTPSRSGTGGPAARRGASLVRQTCRSPSTPQTDRRVALSPCVKSRPLRASIPPSTPEKVIRARLAHPTETIGLPPGALQSQVCNPLVPSSPSPGRWLRA